MRQEIEEADHYDYGITSLRSLKAFEWLSFDHYSSGITIFFLSASLLGTCFCFQCLKFFFLLSVIIGQYLRTYKEAFMKFLENCDPMIVMSSSIT